MSREVKTPPLDTIGINLSHDRRNHVSISEKRFQKRRNRKAITENMMYSLFGLQGSNNDDYRKAHQCANYVFQEGNKTTSNYCKKRCCLVCSSIKARELVEGYAKPLLELDDTYMKKQH